MCSAGQRWVRRFLDYAARQQGVPHPSVAAEGVSDYLTHLAVHDRVSASTQNQACCAIVFLCREVLSVNIGGVSSSVRAKRGERLPVVLSMPETAALLGAMSGVPRLMATLIYGGGLRVSECCDLRVKGVDFDQGGLVVVREGKGAKDRQAGLAGVWLPDALERKYPNAGRVPRSSASAVSKTCCAKATASS